MNKHLQTISFLTFLLLNVYLTFGQDTPDKIKTEWVLVSSKLYKEQLTIQLKAKVPEGWFLQTEVPAENGIPMKIESEQVEIIDSLIIEHLFADEVSNPPIEEIDPGTARFVDGETIFTVRILFKKGRIPNQFSGELIYWMNNHEMAIYPLTYTITIDLARLK